MSRVEEIIEAIKKLSPEERDEVRRQLLSLSLLNSHTKSPIVPMKRARPRRPPIQIKGKLISETVVEERR